MIVAQWKIATSNYAPPARWLWVRVYDTPEAMRKVAERCAPEHDNYGNAVGCVQDITPMIEDEDLGTFQDDLPIDRLWFPESGCAGVVRLCADHLQTEIIFHELAHAACTIYRMNVAQRVDLGARLDESRESEESYAYILGELSSQMLVGLIQHGYGPEEPNVTGGHQEM